MSPSLCAFALAKAFAERRGGGGSLRSSEGARQRPYEAIRSASSGKARRGPNLVHRRRRTLKRPSKTVH